MSNLFKKNNAYVALSSILVISFLIVSISISVTLLSISEGQMSLSDELQLKARNLTEACVGEALLQLASTSNLPTALALPEGNCQLSAISSNNDIWSFQVESLTNDAASKLSIEASLNTTEQAVSIISWKEL